MVHCHQYPTQNVRVVQINTKPSLLAQSCCEQYYSVFSDASNKAHPSRDLKVQMTLRAICANKWISRYSARDGILCDIPGKRPGAKIWFVTKLLPYLVMSSKCLTSVYLLCSCLLLAPTFSVCSEKGLLSYSKQVSSCRIVQIKHAYHSKVPSIILHGR